MSEKKSQAIIAGIKPSQQKLDKGTQYSFCACGRSDNQPFCDGSHKGTGLSSMKFTPEKNENASLCTCKQSQNLPYCDGSHRQLDESALGKTAEEAKSSETTNSAASSSEQSSKKTEPHLDFIHQLAREGLANMGNHGPMVAMGVPRYNLPHWDDLQIMAAQLANRPLMEDHPVSTRLIIGKKAKKPLMLDIPLLVSDMSFGALSQEAKTALAKGAELANTGICSGEGGMLPEEQQANSRYFYEYASAGFGFDESQLEQVQAFHFKAGQAAKTGIGGHLPAEKNTDKIAQVRNLEPGEAAVSPATFPKLHTPEDFKAFADNVRAITGGIPIGFKMSANHIEADLAFALKASADYIILDGRGGATGAAPALFRDHISVPTLPALARARRFLDQQGADHVTLIVTGGLRVPADFVKALALGANGIAIANSALQSIGCVAARICNTNNCPAGIATQKQDLRQKLDIEKSAQQLSRFLKSSVHLMEVLARGCGHDDLQDFTLKDLATWHREIADLTGVHFAGKSIQI